jgi:CheY-like chemotaxis protein
MLSSADSPDLSGVRVLVADDNSLNLLITKKFLGRWNAVVDTADDGAIAVEKARATPYQLILLDIQMPNLDGFGASRAIREFSPTVPILAMSADVVPDEQLVQNQMDGFVLKPFESDSFFQKVKALLDDRR